MPLYEYECSQCHRRTEKIQKFSDPELTVCPHCGGPLARTITAAAISFKGGGWYKDGYASAKPAASGDAAAPPAASAASGDSAPSAPAAAAPAPAATPAAAPAAAAPAASSKA
jgi:putative FmdB family regulatory protein